MQVLTLFMDKVLCNDPKILSQLIFVEWSAVLEIEVDVYPYFLSEMPETINHLSVPFGLSPLAQLIPQAIVVLATSAERFIAFKHVSGDKLVLNVGCEGEVSKGVL